MDERLIKARENWRERTVMKRGGDVSVGDLLLERMRPWLSSWEVLTVGKWTKNQRVILAREIQTGTELRLLQSRQKKESKAAHAQTKKKGELALFDQGYQVQNQGEKRESAGRDDIVGMYRLRAEFA